MSEPLTIEQVAAIALDYAPPICLDCEAIATCYRRHPTGQWCEAHAPTERIGCDDFDMAIMPFAEYDPTVPNLCVSHEALRARETALREALVKIGAMTLEASADNNRPVSGYRIRQIAANALEPASETKE